MVRLACGRKPKPTAAVLDSQSVTSTEVGGSERGYDAGKKLCGRKRHIAVNILGLLLIVVVHAASIQDQIGTKAVLRRLCEKIGKLKVVFADSAYKRDALPQRLQATYKIVLQAVLRPVAVRGVQVLPKRWIVERTFAWIGRCPRHSKDYEHNPQSSEAMIYISMIKLMLRRLEAFKHNFGTRSECDPPTYPQIPQTNADGVFCRFDPTNRPFAALECFDLRHVPQPSESAKIGEICGPFHSLPRLGYVSERTTAAVSKAAPAKRNRNTRLDVADSGLVAKRTSSHASMTDQSPRSEYTMLIRVASPNCPSA